MAKHIHKRFSDEQIKDLMKRYEASEISRKHIQTILGIGQTRFFSLIRSYRTEPNAFSVRYRRNGSTRKISPKIEKGIVRELEASQKLIQNKSVPIWKYNYSFIRQTLREKERQKVALTTHAKRLGFYLPRKKTIKAHDREVLTHHVGELIQHDSSLHLWAPMSGKKWWLITSIDDHSRFMLYARLVDVIKPLPFVETFAKHTKFPKAARFEVPTRLALALERAIVILDEVAGEPVQISISAGKLRLEALHVGRGLLNDSIQIADTIPEITVKVAPDLIKRALPLSSHMVIGEQAIYMTGPDGFSYLASTAGG